MKTVHIFAIATTLLLSYTILTFVLQPGSGSLEKQLKRECCPRRSAKGNANLGRNLERYCEASIAKLRPQACNRIFLSKGDTLVVKRECSEILNDFCKGMGRPEDYLF